MISDDLDRCGPPVCVFRSPYLKAARFELRPIANAPDNTVAILYRRDGDVIRQAGVGKCKAGEWRNSKNKPLGEGEWLWAAMVAE